MSELSREERRQLIERGEGWKLGDETRLLFPQCDQSDITRLPGLLVHYPALSEVDRQRIKQRAIRAALRQGFKLPPSLEKELVTMTKQEQDALKSIAAVVVRERAAIFSEENDEARELAEVKRQAEEYADSLSGRRRASAKDNGHGDVRSAAEQFADEFNRKHGAKRDARR
jgi:hypothetical protein